MNGMNTVGRFPMSPSVSSVASSWSFCQSLFKSNINVSNQVNIICKVVLFVCLGEPKEYLTLVDY